MKLNDCSHVYFSLYRQFERKHLAQIKNVYPLGFIFRQERNIPGENEQTYHLTIESNLARSGGNSEPLKFIFSTDLVNRRRIFRRNLLDIVKQHHRKFLSSLEPPMTIPDDEVNRWHPEFKLDLVPDVETANLPKPPVQSMCHVCDSNPASMLYRVTKFGLRFSSIIAWNWVPVTYQLCFFSSAFALCRAAISAA